MLRESALCCSILGGTPKLLESREGCLSGEGQEGLLPRPCVPRACSSRLGTERCSKLPSFDPIQHQSQPNTGGPPAGSQQYVREGDRLTSRGWSGQADLDSLAQRPGHSKDGTGGTGRARSRASGRSLKAEESTAAPSPQQPESQGQRRRVQAVCPQTDTAQCGMPPSICSSPQAACTPEQIWARGGVCPALFYPPLLQSKMSATF